MPVGLVGPACALVVEALSVCDGDSSSSLLELVARIILLRTQPCRFRQNVQQEGIVVKVRYRLRALTDNRQGGGCTSTSTSWGIWLRSRL